MCVMVVLSGSVLSWAQFLHSRLKASSVVFFSCCCCYFVPFQLTIYIPEQWETSHIQRFSTELTNNNKKCPDKFKLIFCAPLQWVRIEIERVHIHTQRKLSWKFVENFSLPQQFAYEWFGWATSWKLESDERFIWMGSELIFFGKLFFSDSLFRLWSF